MTHSEWVDYWLSRAPMLSDDAMEDIHDVLAEAEPAEG